MSSQFFLAKGAVFGNSSPSIRDMTSLAGEVWCGGYLTLREEIGVTIEQIGCAQWILLYFRGRVMVGNI